MNEEICLFLLATIQWVQYLAPQVSKVCNLWRLLSSRHKLLRRRLFEQGVEDRSTSFYVVNFCKALEFRTSKLWLTINWKLILQKLIIRQQVVFSSTPRSNGLHLDKLCPLLSGHQRFQTFDTCCAKYLTP